MTKFTEHLRRRFFAIPAKFWASLITLCSLSLTLFALTLTLNVVTVSDSNGMRHTLVTYEEDPHRLMEMADIVAEEDDVFYYTAYNGNLASLSIQRAFPVPVTADGELHTARLSGGTVQDVLKRCGITLGEHDYTEPSLHEPISPETEVTVHRVEYRDTVTHESIPFETEYQYSSLFYRNKRRTMVVQEGAEGTNEITNRERMVDGKLESSQVINVEQIAAPRKQIIKSYQAGAPVSDMTGPEIVNGVPSSYSAVYTGRATGYSSSRGRGASGLGLHYGTVAVNPAVIPYGTKLYITSTDGKFVYGYAIATDTGGSLLNGGALVDLYYESYGEALLNGVQQVNVYVVG